MALEDTRKKNVEEGQLAVVVGAGRSGMAAVRLLARKGARVRLLDKDEKNISPDFRTKAEKVGVEIICGEHKPEHFAWADVVIPSPGMPAASLYPLLSKEDPPLVMAEMELAYRQLSGEPIIAITGTSGKTTTASLTAAMLREQGLTVFLGGNIGTPLCEYVLSGRKADVLVVEISSFQLQTCTTFCPKVAVLLNISENHLDYHADMREYIEAKFRVFRSQEAGDAALLAESMRPLAEAYNLKARRIFFTAQERFKRTALLGAHNQANMEAAWQACRQFGVSMENAAKAVAAFKPLPHRLEIAAEKDGVIYINDSKSTTVAALRVALEAMKSIKRPTILLAGGKFKGGDLPGLTGLLRAQVKAVALFGACRDNFEQAWQGVVPLSWDPTLKDALARAQAMAVSGDAVLMSPATASYDLYKDYTVRGDDFKKRAKEL